MVLDRNWRPPKGLLKTVRKHAADLPDRWHPSGRMVALPGHAGLRLHVVSEGPEDAPPVLLLHGFVQSSWCWRNNIERLAEHHRVHAVCAAGFGWSDKPGDLSYALADRARRTIALMDALGIARAHLVGNSLGGALASWLAARVPDRVGRVVLANPAGPGVYPMAFIAWLQRQRFGPLYMLPGVSIAFWIGLRYAAYAGIDVDEHYMRHFAAPLAQPGAVDAALAVAVAYNKDMKALGDLLPIARKPTLVIRGVQDRVLPGRIIEHHAAALPHARLVRYPASAHCPHEEEPLRFDRDVLRFLRADGAD